MRTETRTRTIYLFDELPTEEAKEAARDWWRGCEAQDPSWLREHRESLEAALDFLRSYNRAHTIADMFDAVKGFRVDPNKSCPWTGYCADEVAIDAILAAESWAGDQLADVIRAVEEAMDKAWEDEQETNMEDENVEESIRANEYEFTEYGGIV